LTTGTSYQAKTLPRAVLLETPSWAGAESKLKIAVAIMVISPYIVDR
jgi:hypothetical protein